MMQVRIDTGRGPTFQELPDTPPPGAAGNLFLKKLENAVDKKAAPALSDSVPAPPTLAVDAEPSTSTLALQDQPSPTLAGDAEPSTTAQELRLRVMNARQQQVETRKAKVLFFQSVAVTTAQNLFPGGDDRSYMCICLFMHAHPMQAVSATAIMKKPSANAITKKPSATAIMKKPSATLKTKPSAKVRKGKASGIVVLAFAHLAVTTAYPSGDHRHS